MLTTLANQLEDWQIRASRAASGEEVPDELRRPRPGSAATASRTSRGAGRRTRTTSTSSDPTASGTSTARAASRPSERPRRHASPPLNALATGAYVKAERISLADFLVDEWLPSRRPPVLEESTWHSYDRYLRLHVIPHIGAIPLQKLTPVDLNQLYRRLLESGRHQPGPRPGRSPAVAETSGRAAGRPALTYERIADQLRVEFEGEAAITKNAVAALLRRAATERPRDHPNRRPVATDSALHPHDHPRRPQGRPALEPGRAQRR